MARKREYVEVKIWRTGKYPYKCTRIGFQMIDDGSQYDAVKMLMAYMGAGRYSFINPEQHPGKDMKMRKAMPHAPL